MRGDKLLFRPLFRASPLGGVTLASRGAETRHFRGLPKSRTARLSFINVGAMTMVSCLLAEVPVAYEDTVSALERRIAHVESLAHFYQDKVD